MTLRELIKLGEALRELAVGLGRELSELLYDFTADEWGYTITPLHHYTITPLLHNTIAPLHHYTMTPLHQVGQHQHQPQGEGD